MTTINVDRFEVPLYSVTDAARILGVPRSKLVTWVDGYSHTRNDRATPRTVMGAPLVTAKAPKRRGYPRLPFVGIAEAYVLNAFRQAGVPMQRIRPSIDALLTTVGPHALASKALYTDGAEILWDLAERSGPASDDRAVAKRLIIPRSGQYVFQEVVDRYLKQVSWGPDNFAEQIRLPQFEHANVIIDPRRSYGQPVFADSGVRLVDALGPIRAGESLEAVAEDYGVAIDQLRVAADSLVA